MNIKRIILIIFLAAFAVRLSAVVFLSDTSQPNSYEYGALAANLINGKGYSLFYFEGDKLSYQYKDVESAFPSSYMMPGYPLFLAAIISLTGSNSYFSLFLIQALLSALTAVLLYKLAVQFLNNKFAILAAAIYIFLPEMIYPVISVGPTVFIHFLLVLLFYMLSTFEIKKNSIYLIGLISVSIIYMRPADLLFIILILAYFLFKSKLKQALIISLFLILGLAPWIVRNYYVFDKFIPLTTSTGQNVFRGHNQVYPGYWAGEQEADDIKGLVRDKNFELTLNDYFFSKGIKNIKEKPFEAFVSGFEKLYHLWVYYPYDARTNNLLYLLPWLFLMPFTWVAVFIRFDFKHKIYLYFYILACSLNSMIFFSLLRYQTIMKIAVIPLAVQGMFIVWDIFVKKNKTA